MILADLLDYQALVALASVVVIDVVLAGDNAVVVGMAAAGLPREQQNRVIALGIQWQPCCASPSPWSQCSFSPSSA